MDTDCSTLDNLDVHLIRNISHVEVEATVCSHTIRGRSGHSVFQIESIATLLIYTKFGKLFYDHIYSNLLGHLGIVGII